MEISFRPATMADADLLMAWRNDPLTRANCYSTDPVSRDEHYRWLVATLKNPNREMYVAVMGERPIGSMRVDREPGCVELSWEIAPEMRGKGLGTQLLNAFTASLHEPYRAEVKMENRASAKMAVTAGMRLVEEREGVLYFAS